jgi:hypothetical protein
MLCCPSRSGRTSIMLKAVVVESCSQVRCRGRSLRTQLTVNNPATFLAHRHSSYGVWGRWTCIRLEDGDGSGPDQGSLAPIAFSCKPTSTTAKSSSTARPEAKNGPKSHGISTGIDQIYQSSTKNASAEVPKTPACFQARSSAERLVCMAQPTPPRPDTRLALRAPKIQFSFVTGMRHSDSVSASNNDSRTQSTTMR